MKSVCRSLIGMILPDPCLICKGPKLHAERYLCMPCYLSLPRVAHLGGNSEQLAAKCWGLLPVERTLAFLKFRRGNAVQRLMHALKYQNLPELGPVLGWWFATEVLIPFNLHFDVVVPVPLHPGKLRARGYNQSLLIAHGITRLGGNLVECLCRDQPAKTQTKLSRWHRFEHTEHQFSLHKGTCLSNQKVLLVDDIVTTGATLVACAQPLIEAGARVSLATIALSQEK